MLTRKHRRNISYRVLGMVSHAALLYLNCSSIKLHYICSFTELDVKVKEKKNIVYHSSNVAAARDLRTADIAADVRYWLKKAIFVRCCYWIKHVRLWTRSPLYRQTTRSRGRLMSCGEGGQCKMRPGPMIPNQGKRIKEPGGGASMAPSFSHCDTLTGMCGSSISPEPCWETTIMVIMMNWVIWMLLALRYPGAVCSSQAYELTEWASSHTQLRPWSSPGARPLSHEAFGCPRNMIKCVKQTVMGCDWLCLGGGVVQKRPPGRQKHSMFPGCFLFFCCSVQHIWVTWTWIFCFSCQ